MKKQIALAAGLAVLSTGALASKARLQALGEDTYGSMFLDDSRNVLLNPAHLNVHKDMVMLELGSSRTTGSLTAENGANNDQDTIGSARAEGGYFKAAGNMVYGIYFGEETNTGNAIRTAAMGSDAVHEDNVTTLMLAGDAGVQWGVKLSYSDYKNDGDNEESNSARATIGLNSGDFESFLQVGLSNTASGEASTDTSGAGGYSTGDDISFEGKGSYQLGVTYNLGDIDIMAEYRGITAEDEDGNEFTASFTRVGVAKTYKLNERATLWTSAWYKMDTTENDMTLSNLGGGFGSDYAGEYTRTYLPVTIALEYAAKEWLALRGSVTGEVFGTNENDAGDEMTRASRTQVNVGASLIFGDFNIDAAFGTEDHYNCEKNIADSGSDNMMSRVSMTYKF